MLEAQKNITLKRWIQVAFINLLVVAFLGTIMRYKIAYYLPFVDQDNFLQAHSHFAFSGWVTQVLMVLMWAFLYKYLPAKSLKKYQWLMIANLVAAYGTLVSFIWQGYGAISTIFSSLSILVSWSFAFIFWRDANKIKITNTSVYWFKAALLFNVFSSFGAFFISYLVANNIQQPDWYLAATYYFLHFQYNGWFFFACMGLLIEDIRQDMPLTLQKVIFWLFALACVPAYFLSALWLPIPTWVYVLVVAAAIADLAGLILLIKFFFQNKATAFANVQRQVKCLFILSATALSIKILLQLGSTIPYLSKLAFGFRPVVIGYLHLMFLGVISIFMIGFVKMKQFIITGKAENIGIAIFVAGIILNEFFLMVQGLSYMNYVSVPYINQLLLGAAICMLFGASLLIQGVSKRSATNYLSK
ncbi:MAG TPA: hypothetical protein VMU83_14910 [Hanamia sp.]|nr:hypothetical protein [Hanamia sp.]